MTEAQNVAPEDSIERARTGIGHHEFPARVRAARSPAGTLGERPDILQGAQHHLAVPIARGAVEMLR